MATYVLIVDDHAPSNEGLRRCLEARGLEVVGEARNGAEAFRVAEQVQPDVVQLDVSLSDNDGFDVAHRVGESPSLRFMVLQMVGDRAAVSAAIEAGVKDSEWSEMVAKIEAVPSSD